MCFDLLFILTTGFLADNTYSFQQIFMDQKPFTRRQAIGGIGAGLATFVVAPAFGGQTGTTNNNNFLPPDLEDPTTKYPKPPFKEQMQPWPGLANKMDPVPDHGEKSYKGS